MTPDYFNDLKAKSHDNEGGYGKIYIVKLKPDQPKNLKKSKFNEIDSDYHKFAIKITNLLSSNGKENHIEEANKRECRILKNLKNELGLGLFVDFFEFDDQLFFIFVEN